MPRLSDSMEEGTILRWLKASGDEVARGEEIVEIETDKANMTYESDAAGVLEIVASEGDTLPIGELIARVGDGSAPEQRESTPAQQQQTRGARSEEEAAPEEAPAPSPSPSMPVVDERAEEPQPTGANGRIKASPVARRLAREMGVDIAALSGSGPGGRIVKADVEGATQGAPAEAPAAPAAPAAVPAPVTSGERGSG